MVAADGLALVVAWRYLRRHDDGWLSPSLVSFSCVICDTPGVLPSFLPSFLSAVCATTSEPEPRVDVSLATRRAFLMAEAIGG